MSFSTAGISADLARIQIMTKCQKMIYRDRTAATTGPTTRAAPKGGSCAAIVENLLADIYMDTDCSKPFMVDPRRFELLTSSMRTRRATNCAKGP